MCDEDDLLDILLSTAAEEIENQSQNATALKETDIFKGECLEDQTTELKTNITKSVIHKGDTDSSDDEENRDHENRKYNDSGKEIKRILTADQPHSQPINGFYGPRERVSWKTKAPGGLKSSRPGVTPQKSREITKEKFDVFIDPIFGLRIKNPLISSTVLQERMAGRDAVQFSRLGQYIQKRKSEQDWVLAGVIANKSAVKTSQKGKNFLIWTLTDLKDDIKTVAVFLFGSACHQLWKTQVGVVIGILNPHVLDKKDGSKDVASLSIDNAQKVMIFGTSKDLGTCKSTKKNGEKCTAIVNVNKCEYCLYHIKQEYQKMSQRSELQSNFVGRGLVALRNKVLGKNEVFYAGKSYMAIPAKKSKKLEQRDNHRLNCLSGLSTLSNNIVKAKNRGTAEKKQNASRFDVPHAQRMKDLALLKKLGGSSNIESKTNFSGVHSSEVTLEESKNTALDIISKLKDKNIETTKVVNTQYDRRSDLIVNVDNKQSFTGKVSEEVSLEESRTTAKSVIAKLKEKKKKDEDTMKNNVDVEVNKDFGNEDIFNDDLCLEYDDLLDSSNKKGKDVEQETKNYKNSVVENSPNNKKITNLEETKKVSLRPNSTPSHSSTKTPAGETRSTEKIHRSPIQHPETLNNLPSSLNKTSKNKEGSKMLPTSFAENSFRPNLLTNAPTLSKFGFENGFIDLNEPIRKKSMTKAKVNALNFVKTNGPIKKIDPNSSKGSSSSGKKRFTRDSEVEVLNPKKSKLAESDLISDRFKRMMAVSSRHSDLLEQRDNEEQDKYFRKQEIKEQMEEKMVNTMKVACKAVRCLKCKYTSFSASDYCKKEGHPLKVFDATKRFFKCADCQNRTACLEIFPTEPCKNCSGSRWEKTGMMKEKVVGVVNQLSIRGGEQKFMNSVVADANINLLVPDND